MSEDNEFLDDFLTQYSSLKTSGKSCTVKEATEWYNIIYEQSYLNINKALIFYKIRVSKKLPLKKMSEENINQLIDDADCLTEYLSMFNYYTKLLFKLKNNPEEFNAWKGEYEFKNGKEIIYYVEPKSFKNNNEELFL